MALGRNSLNPRNVVWSWGPGPSASGPARAAKPASQRINGAEQLAFLQADARRSALFPTSLARPLAGWQPGLAQA